MCDKTFALKCDLDRHIAMGHENQRSFECNICGKKYNRKGCLNIHIATIHEIENPLKCNLCAKQFAHIGNLNRHVAKVHKKKKGKTKKVKKVNIQNETLSEIEKDHLEVKCEPFEVKSELMEAEDQMNNFVFSNNDPNLEGEEWPEMKDQLNMACNVKTEEPELKPIKKSKKQEFVVKQEHQDEPFDI